MSIQNQMSVSTAIEADIKTKDIIDSHNNIYLKGIIPKAQQKSSINCKFYGSDVFSQLKNTLDTRQTLEYYGVQVNNRGFASCPFHQERTPSFKVYDGSYYCFGCGENGTVIDFVMKYFKLTSIEAVKKLNQDFGLNLPTAGTGYFNPSRISIQKMQDDKNLVADFERWERRAHSILCEYFRALRFWGEQYFVKQVKYFEKYLPELENICFVEILLDLMMENTGDFRARAEFYRDFGKAVLAVEKRLRTLNA